MVGKCRLCLEQRELQRSHLLPKALYRLIGSGTDPDHPDTVQLSSDSIKESSRQVWCHLLCSECEDRLNKNGEKWVLHNCYRGGGRFHLRDKMRTRPNLGLGLEVEAYLASAEETSKLTYFALSVIWRASLCNWFCRGETFQQIELGPYQEKIRKYIKREVGSLPRVEVRIELSELDPPWLAMCLPCAYRVDSGRCHRFHIPGITFLIAVGGSASAQNGSALQSPRPIFVGRDGDKVAQAEMMRLMKRKPPRGYEVPIVNGTERIK
jgi:hypothetical protein